MCQVHENRYDYTAGSVWNVYVYNLYVNNLRYIYSVNRFKLIDITIRDMDRSYFMET